MSTATLDTRPQLRLPLPARYAMAACAVLAPALFLIAVLLHPVEITAEGREAVRQFAAGIDGYTASSWLDPIATFLWIPAVLMVGRVARTRAPVLGLTGMVLAFGLAIPVALSQGDLTYVALRSGLPVDAVTKLLDTAESVPSSVLGEGWLIGLIGLIVLGAAILRGKSAPAWAGLALIVAPLAIPASWISGSLVAVAAAWAVLAVGFAGCAVVLVRRTDT